MPAKSKTGASRIGRRRGGRAGRLAGWDTARGITAPPSPTTDDAAARREREAAVSQDTAVYTCQCGLVFEALVSTSVDCPHCGGGQAW